MKVKALTSFAGPVTMFGGETRDITDEKVLKDLIKCGYVEAVEDAKASPPPANLEGDADGEGNTNSEGSGNANTDGGNNANIEDDGKVNSDDDSNANTDGDKTNKKSNKKNQ